MRLALYSDLHLEMIVHFKGTLAWEPPALDVDAVILAGDIGSHVKGLEWAAKAFTQVPDVFYVAGNHEYYDEKLDLLSRFEEPRWEQLGVHFMERRCFELHGVRFLGCTLWSGFDLYGADLVNSSMEIARRSLNDYWLIQSEAGDRLEPIDTLKLHQAAVHWLDSELAKPFDGKTVVITHFAPHRQCVAPEHQGSDVSPYFVNDLSWLLEKHRIDLWCYGHTHTNADFVAENGCRVLSNQRGYQREIAASFCPSLTIEV